MLQDTSKSNQTKTSTGSRSGAHSQKSASTKNAGGRPHRYTSELAAEICERIANGETLMRICQDPHIPSRSTVTSWLMDEDKSEFLNQYARARDVQADFWADETVEIADDRSNDWIKRTNGEGEDMPATLNYEHVQRSKVRIETRQWIIERLNPKKYGRKTELKHDVGDSFAKLWQMIGSGEGTGKPDA